MTDGQAGPENGGGSSPPTPVPPPAWAPPWADDLTLDTYQKLAEVLYTNEKSSDLEGIKNELAASLEATKNELAGSLESMKNGLAAELEILKDGLSQSQSRLASQLRLREAGGATEEALQKSFHDSLVEVSKGTLTRAQTAAELVQKGAGAIVTLYTGVLALAFAASDRPLPLRGLLPAVFLGLAVAFSTGYIAYLSHPPATAPLIPSSLPREHQMNRTVTFIRWISNTAMHRALWMRRAVVSLAIGAVVLPLPFLQFPATETPAPAAVDWPTAPARVDDATVELFKAQVAEAARLREASQGVQPTDDPGLVLLIGLFGLFLVLTLPLRSAPPDGQGPGIPPAVSE